MATLNSSNITDGNTIEPTDIIQLYDAFKSGGGTTGAYSVSISGSLTGSASTAISSSFATTASYVNTLSQSVIISGSILSNTTNPTLGQFVGNQNGYAEFSVRNTNTGASASGDFAVYADTGTVLNNYIDMGINNSGLNPSYFYGGTDFGNALDAYVYNVGGNLRIGNATSQAPFSQSLLLFSNPTATPNIWITGSQVAIGKNLGNRINGTFDISGSTCITGSLNVSGSITGSISGSLSGTSSFALNSGISTAVSLHRPGIETLSAKPFAGSGSFSSGIATINMSTSFPGLSPTALGTDLFVTAMAASNAEYVGVSFTSPNLTFRSSTGAGSGIFYYQGWSK